MMTVVKKIWADGKIEDGEWQMTLRQMQEFVGGYIERLASCLPQRCLIINEGGAIDCLSENPEATKLVREGYFIQGGSIKGNALLVKS